MLSKQPSRKLTSREIAEILSSFLGSMTCIAEKGGHTIVEVVKHFKENADRYCEFYSSPLFNIVHNLDNMKDLLNIGKNEAKPEKEECKWIQSKECQDETSCTPDKVCFEKKPKREMCKGMPHGSCKGETMCDTGNACFEKVDKITPL